MKEDGCEIFITHLRNPNQPLLENELVCSPLAPVANDVDASFQKHDIVIRNEVL